MKRVSFNKKGRGIIAKIAFAVAKSNANAVCLFMFNQPKLPEKVKKLRKF